MVPGLKIAPAVLDKLKEGEIALSPGMKHKHYAPSASLYLLKGDNKARQNYIKSLNEPKMAILCYEEEIVDYETFLPKENLYSLGKEADVATQAHRLFQILRATDQVDYSVLYAPLPPERGLGLALYNRMIRAAAHQILTLSEKDN